jgi:hypothetical protein
MTRLHLHLLSDSTGETLEMIAKAALAQFDDADIVRHFWPMVRSQQHLDRIMGKSPPIRGLSCSRWSMPKRASGWSSAAPRSACPAWLRSMQ